MADAVYQTTRTLEPPREPPEAGRFRFVMCLDREELETIYHCLDEGGRALGYGRQGPHLEAFWQGLAYIGRGNRLACADDTGKNRKQEVYSDMGDIIIYNCGCGCEDTPPGATATGGGTEGGTGQSAVQFPAGEAVPTDCYAVKAVDYLLDRAADWHQLMLDVAFLGWDGILGPVDEFVDGAAIVVGLLTGDVDVNSVKEFTEANITAAFEDAALRATMRAAWVDLEFSGAVSRGDLTRWANKAPILVGAAPMRSWLLQWLYGSIIPQYNQSLARFAQECASGVDISPGFSISTPFTISSENYVLLVGTKQTIKVGEPVVQKIPVGYELAGIYWTTDNEIFSGSVRPNIQFRETLDGQTSLDGGGQQYHDQSGYHYRRVLSTDPTNEDVAAVFPAVAVPEQHAPVDTAYPSIDPPRSGDYKLQITDDAGQDGEWSLDYTVNLLLRSLGA